MGRRYEHAKMWPKRQVDKSNFLKTRPFHPHPRHACRYTHKGKCKYLGLYNKPLNRPWAVIIKKRKTYRDAYDITDITSKPIGQGTWPMVCAAEGKFDKA